MCGACEEQAAATIENTNNKDLTIFFITDSPGSLSSVWTEPFSNGYGHVDKVTLLVVNLYRTRTS